MPDDTSAAAQTPRPTDTAKPGNVAKPTGTARPSGVAKPAGAAKPAPAEPPLSTERIGAYLHLLADRVPAPGGGAAAALHAAQAAALLGMVARYTTGPRYAEHAGAVARITTATDELRETALQLAEEDIAAFTAVTEAYRLPRGTEDERTARSAAVAAALAGAAEPPAEVIAAAERTVALAEELLPLGNRNVLADIAAATEAARAAATTARVNVEINLTGIQDPVLREQLTTITGRVDTITARAEQVTQAVRTEIAP